MAQARDHQGTPPEVLPGSAVEEDEAEDGVTLELLAEKKPLMD
jgi:hypothetical protein